MCLVNMSGDSVLRKLILVFVVFTALLGAGYGFASKDDVLLSRSIARYHTALDVKDYDRAYTLANQMAADDYIPARTFLAALYEHGHGVTQNMNIAVEQYKLAAMGNDASAQVYLAGMYLRGHGVEVNEKMAKYWYAKAAANGHSKAEFKLALR